jgi:16S rRNA (uracil1498-N3)-methyltransferase
VRRIFVDPAQIGLEAGTVRLIGQDHVHLARVMRARVGQSVVVLDGTGRAYRAELTHIDRRESVAKLCGPAVTPPEPAVFITVGQSLGKADKFEQVVQHGTEAGASAFVPVQAERCVADPPDARNAERLARRRAIAKGAAEQAFRTRIPDVQPPAPLAAVIAAARDEHALCLLLHDGPGAVPLRAVLCAHTAPPEQVLLLVGPEGGWSGNELALAAVQGCIEVSLGPHVLRTETAALVAISQLLYHFSRPEETTECES